MLRFKKMMAVLLAAALALTMLTACGGGGGSSRSEKEKYVAEVNVYLGGLISNFQKLTYDSKMEKMVTDYKTVYESLSATKSEAEAIRLAKNAAKIDGDDYRLIQFKMNADLDKQGQIEKIANEIQKEVKSDGLSKKKWNINYAWGDTETKKNEKMIYIILKQVTE